MGWTYRMRKHRDRVRNDYLKQTGRAQFDPDEFVEWLSQRPDYEAYAVVFGCEGAVMAPKRSDGLRIV